MFLFGILFTAKDLIIGRIRAVPSGYLLFESWALCFILIWVVLNWKGQCNDRSSHKSSPATTWLQFGFSGANFPNPRQKTAEIISEGSLVKDCFILHLLCFVKLLLLVTNFENCNRQVGIISLSSLKTCSSFLWELNWKY